ncbi:MAG: dynamin family protein [Desulfotignum sp.]|nr:dynamin family protein [Desulfotignum sp.]
MTFRPDLYQTIEPIVADILSVIEMMEAVPKMSDNALQSFKNRCRKIPEQIRSNRIKIAVVGVIKSGKSTLINAITGKEVVKRGAGVVTAVTTRIRKGKKNRAVIFLKSWDDINLILRNTLEMFPGDADHYLDIDVEKFDLRRKKDRKFLKQVYDRLVLDFPVTDQGFRPETLVIRNALEGYDACRNKVGADRECLVFEGKQFEDHKAFTGDGAKAFYVADVCLELFGKTLDPRIELADCQGADSTDPTQLARIVTYIQQSNLIIYCISSRTGLRRSDIRFLKIIRGMGLFENILFVNNCDLSEHDTLDDLLAIESRIIHDLEFVSPSPEVYSFSALLDLFCAMEKKLSQRNRKRLALWQDDAAMAACCTKNASRFYERLSSLLARHHHRLLISSHLERLLQMVRSMEKKAILFMEMLDTDITGREHAKNRITQIQNSTVHLKSIVDHSIPGVVSGLIREVDTHLENAFAKDAIHIGQKIREFVQLTQLDAVPYQNRIKELGVKKMLYLMFQDFKRDLDLFVISHIMPDIKILVIRQEKRIQKYFQSLLDSYQVDFLKSFQNMAPEDDAMTARLESKHRQSQAGVDVQAIKKILGLTLPEITISPRYSGRIQVDALTGMGLKSAAQLFSTLFNKHTSFSFTPGFDTAARKIKKQTLQGVTPQIDLFHIRLKNRYFTPLIQAVTRDFTDKIHERFSLYESLDTDMAAIFELDHARKQAQKEKLSCIISRLKQIRQDISQLK